MSQKLKPICYCYTLCPNDHRLTKPQWELTSVVGGADAGVVVDAIDAGGVVLTVVVFTIVGVYLTPLTLETRRTHTARERWRNRATLLGLLF